MEFFYPVTGGNEFECPAFENGTIRFVKVSADMARVVRLRVFFLLQGKGEALFRVGGEIHGVNVHGLIGRGFT